MELSPIPVSKADHLLRTKRRLSGGETTLQRNIKASSVAIPDRRGAWLTVAA
jgi:hypothetical protein